MSTLVKILKSDTIEAEERQIARLKKELVFLTEDLQLREMTLENRKARNQQ